MFFQCKKIDSQLYSGADQNNPDATGLIKQKFFDTNNVSSPMILAIVEKIQRQELQKPFVEKFVKYAGYPLWNKSFVMASRSSGIDTLSKGGAEPETLIMIPFALENDSSVHSILQVSTTQRDTAFKMLYKQLYNQNGYQKIDSANNADELALLFMVMENKSFGYKYFKINDSLLFNSTLPGVKGKRVRLLDQTGTTQRGGGYWLYVTTCYEVDVPNWEGQLHGCPPNEPCPLYIRETTCSTASYYFPDGGGSGSGGGGNPTPPSPPNGGGGAGSGDWSSDPCTNCTPTDVDGWQSIPDDDLKTLLNLNNAQTNWLSQNAERKTEITNYLEKSSATNKEVIAVNHINRMMSDADYLSFVIGHAQTGNGQVMWWEDAEWLAVYGGIDFGNWAIEYLTSNSSVHFSLFANQFMGKPEGQDGEYNAEYWDNPNLTFPQQNLPSWSNFEAAFPKDSDPLYNTPEKMYNSIGGDVKDIYSGPSTNTCAVRLSKALNYSGITIPHIPNITFKGADNKYYFKAAYELNLWMRKTFGTHDGDPTTPLNLNHYSYTQLEAGVHGVNLPGLLTGKKGIYLIYSSDFGWATGHADLLYDNATCGNNCHFYDAPILRLDVWVLN